MLCYYVNEGRKVNGPLYFLHERKLCYYVMVCKLTFLVVSVSPADVAVISSATTDISVSFTIFSEEKLVVDL